MTWSSLQAIPYVKMASMRQVSEKLYGVHQPSTCGQDPISISNFRHLIVRYRAVSKPWDWYFELSHYFRYQQAPRQYYCRYARQISERSANYKYQSRGFETSRDLTRRCRMAYRTLKQGPDGNGSRMIYDSGSLRTPHLVWLWFAGKPIYQTTDRDHWRERRGIKYVHGFLFLDFSLFTLRVIGETICCIYSYTSGLVH